jgi:hypothetical protein
MAAAVGGEALGHFIVEEERIEELGPRWEKT